MHRALLFKLGIIPLVFLLWGWRDTIRHYSYASCETAGYDLTVYHTHSRFYLEFSSGAARGLPGNFDFFRKKDFDGRMPFNGPASHFPAPTFKPEVPDIPFEQLSVTDSFRAEIGDRSGGITLPYWLAVLIYVASWLGVSRFATRNRRLCGERNYLTDSPHGNISP